jgi:hypothetical protein
MRRATALTVPTSPRYACRPGDASSYAKSTTVPTRQSAKLNGIDPYAYLKDVLERLPTRRASAMDALLLHRWAPAT